MATQHRIDERRVVRHDGIDRSYLIYSSNVPTTTSRPVVIMLHGAGGTAEWAEEECGWGRFAVDNDLIVVYPEGLPQHRDRPPKFLTNPQEWNDGSGRGSADDVGFLDRIVDELTHHDAADPTRIFVTGFSNGAGMTFRYAAERADRVAAIAPVSGHCWVTAPAVRPIPTLYLIGDADPFVPMAGGTARTPWGRYHGRPPVLQTIARWTSVMGRSAGPPPDHPDWRVRIIPGHGHHWPGGKGRMGVKIGGPMSDEVDAVRVIWDFFQLYRI